MKDKNGKTIDIGMFVTIPDDPIFGEGYYEGLHQLAHLRVEGFREEYVIVKDEQGDLMDVEAIRLEIYEEEKLSDLEKKMNQAIERNKADLN